MSRVIAATGVTGVVGRRVLQRLAAARPGDVSLRMVVRDTARARVHGADPVVVANPGGYRDSEGLRGAHTVYLVSAAEVEDRVRQHLTAVDAAAAARVQRMVSGSTTLSPTPRTLRAGP